MSRIVYYVTTSHWICAQLHCVELSSVMNKCANKGRSAEVIQNARRGGAKQNNEIHLLLDLWEGRYRCPNRVCCTFAVLFIDLQSERLYVLLFCTYRTARCPFSNFPLSQLANRVTNRANAGKKRSRSVHSISSLLAAMSDTKMENPVVAQPVLNPVFVGVTAVAVPAEYKE
jgi:hypothetical protein